MKNFSVVNLELRGYPIPGKKNSKMIVSLRGKRPMLITKPEIQKTAKKMEESIVSQLLSASRTEGGVTLTGAQLRSWIRSSLPLDDCWTQVKELNLKAVLVPKGHEGCNIKIERIK